MIDLTKIEKPFGLLDKTTQKALEEYKGPIEYYNANYGWVSCDPVYYKSAVYRVQPKSEQILLDTLKNIITISEQFRKIDELTIASVHEVLGDIAEGAYETLAIWEDRKSDD